MIFVTFGPPSWPKLKKCVKKVPFWLSQAKITENDQPWVKLFRHPGAKNHTFRIFPALLSIFFVLEKSEKYDFLLQGAWTIVVKVGHFQWFWLGTTKKALFWHILSILAMKGPQTWQKSLITWKYYGKTPLEKKIGAVSFTGGWAILFEKKKYGPFHWSCSSTYSPCRSVGRCHVLSPLILPP